MRQRGALMTGTSEPPAPPGTPRTAPRTPDGWPGLFSAAFLQSRNPMVLVDDQRMHVDANGAYLRILDLRRDAILGLPISRFVAGGPLATPAEWAAATATRRFTGEAHLIGSDGGLVAVQWGATTEVVTGRRLVLFVALSTSRWGRRFRRGEDRDGGRGVLSAREREIVGLVAHGHTGREIADELRIAHDTVRTHVGNAMIKLQARSRAQLVAKAIGEGLLD
jgi:DNA-binding CsgD family transcriptional regulator